MYSLLDECSCYKVDMHKISNEAKEKLAENYSISGDEALCFVYMSDIKAIGIPDDAIEFYMFDEYVLDSILSDAIGNFPYYLVFASSCRWNDESGYKFCENIGETCYRDYDVDIIVQDEITGKALICMESSHDRPTGSRTIIVGLTEDEYEKLNEADFKEIEQFVNKITSK